MSPSLSSDARNIERINIGIVDNNDFHWILALRAA